jgi:peptide deformylase
VFVAAISPDNEEPLPAEAAPMVFINPVVLPVGTDTVEDWEGCLSVPDLRGRVPRARTIKVSALDRSGERLEVSTHDFPARVIQHETDHLDGVLFLDRMKKFDTLTFLDEYARYWVKD